MMRAFRPRGIRIYRALKSKDLNYVCTIKSRGRTGARIRSQLMAMTPKQREPYLAAWVKGEAIELPPPVRAQS